MKKRSLRTVGICLAVCLALLLLCACADQGQTLRVCVLDVGQSDCILLSQGEAHLLIDTGTASERDALVGELAHYGVKQLEAVVITHPHEDHYGNARTVLEKYQTKALLLPECAGEEYGYAMVTDAAEREGVSVQYLEDGSRFSLGKAAFEVMSALPDDKNLNNASLVLRATFGETVLLFMGDAERAAEQALLDAYGSEALGCDFLKVGHHGSNTASGEAFLQAASPLVAAISCGANNEFGFPHADVMERLSAVGATVYRTDTEGTLEFIFDGEKISRME